MDAAEIRGNFVSLFAQVDDPGILKVMLDKCLEILRACWGFGFRGKNRQFFDETRRKNGSIAIPK